MKKMIAIIAVIVLAALASGYVENAAQSERNAKIDCIIHAALYGQEYLDRRELAGGRLKWRHSEKLHAERISSGEFKVYVPKAMYSVKARLAELGR